MNHRNELMRAYGHLYSRHMLADMHTCFYCGSRREVLDHRPPISAFDAFTLVDFQRAKVPLVLLPSCANCNSRLGNRYLATAEEAIAFLVKKLEAEYEQKSTLWSEEEIQEMSPTFQTMLRARKIMLNDLHARIRFLQKRALETHLMPEFEEESGSGKISPISSQG